MATSNNSSRANSTDMSDKEILELAGRLVTAFLRLLDAKRPGPDIVDSEFLPSSREVLESAFRLAVINEPDAQARRRLIEAGCELAQFQSDVGERITLVPARSTLSSRSSENRATARLNMLISAAASDRERLATMLALAEATAVRRTAKANVRQGFAEDGTYTWLDHRSRH